MKHKKIHTRYNQFGGYGSEVRTTILNRPQTKQTRSFKKADESMRAETVSQIDELYVGKAKQHLIKCAERIQKTRVKLKAKEAAGEKIDWTQSCWPFGIEARCRSWDAERDIEAIHVALGLLHDEYQAGNRLIPKEIFTICPGFRLDPYSPIKDYWVRTDLQSLLRYAVADLEQKGLGPYKRKPDNEQQNQESESEQDIKFGPAILKAYQSLQYVENQNPELKGATDKEVYEWLIDAENKENEDHPYYDKTMPNYSAWSRYIRKVRHHTGTQKKQPRIGQPHGSSIVNVNQIKYQSSQHPEPD